MLAIRRNIDATVAGATMIDVIGLPDTVIQLVSVKWYNDFFFKVLGVSAFCAAVPLDFDKENHTMVTEPDFSNPSFLSSFLGQGGVTPPLVVQDANKKVYRRDFKVAVVVFEPAEDVVPNVAVELLFNLVPAEEVNLDDNEVVLRFYDFPLLA